MKRAALLLLTGCTSIFGLDPPKHQDAAIDVPPTDVAPDVITGACPMTYTLTFGTSHYRFASMMVSWPNAATDCADDGATGSWHTHLVVISDDNERIYLKGVSDKAFWVGLSDLNTEGTFVWNTDEDTSAYPIPWSQNEPTGITGENCGATSTSGSALIDDNACMFGTPFICECDLHPNDTTNYTP